MKQNIAGGHLVGENPDIGRSVQPNVSIQRKAHNATADLSRQGLRGKQDV
jgi:hypothetical protein